jgi:steroid 5-alpha reductase family enzyme
VASFSKPWAATSSRASRQIPTTRAKSWTAGLWRYTRHPNYFGDATVWWGYYIIAAGTTHGWLTIFSPSIMTVLLMRVSGVSLLERTLKRTKPEYEDYTRRTSAFFPWPPAR